MAPTDLASAVVAPAPATVGAVFASLPSSLRNPGEMSRGGGADDYQLRLERLRRVEQRAGQAYPARRYVTRRRVRAVRKTENDQRQVVQLARCASQNGKRTCALSPAAGQAKQTSSYYAGRKMLLRDARAPASHVRRGRAGRG